MGFGGWRRRFDSEFEQNNSFIKQAAAAAAARSMTRRNQT
jgi:hypothetical protein